MSWSLRSNIIPPVSKILMTDTSHHRGLEKAQKIRMRLGGSPNMLETFPEKPKGLHWRTYDRLRRAHDMAQERSMIGLMQFINRVRSERQN